MPTAEFCYNGADDDCDGRIDCADADCMPSTQCVALDAAGARIGLMMAATATCPPNYTDMTALYQTLSGGACTGCSCRPPTLLVVQRHDCLLRAPRPIVRSASNPGTSEGIVELDPGVHDAELGGQQLGQVYGIQAGAFQPTLTGSCVPQGTPTPGAAGWATSGRFCAATMVGAGCATGQICVPNVPPTPSKCVMWEGLHTCQAATTTTYWNTGFTDTRTCGACTCGAPDRTELRRDAHPGRHRLHLSPHVTATLSSGHRTATRATAVLLARARSSPGTATQPTCPGSATLRGR